MRDISFSKPLFGPYAETFGPVASSVINRSIAAEYSFIDNSHFMDLVRAKKLSVQDVNEISVRELLYNCHMAAVLSIIRSVKWMESAWREHEADNVLAWANSMRALIESIADTNHDLIAIAFSVANHKDKLSSALNGTSQDIFNIKELEDRVVHFFQAKKLTKNEKEILPDEFLAKQTWQYIKTLQNAGLDGLYDLYSHLSEISHPSSHSLKTFFRQTDSGSWMIDEYRDAQYIKEICEDNKIIIFRLVGYAFLPGFLMLKALVKFHIFPLPRELKDFNFDIFARWQEFKALLDK